MHPPTPSRSVLEMGQVQVSNTDILSLSRRAEAVALSAEHQVRKSRDVTPEKNYISYGELFVVDNSAETILQIYIYCLLIVSLLLMAVKYG